MISCVAVRLITCTRPQNLIGGFDRTIDPDRTSRAILPAVGLGDVANPKCLKELSVPRRVDRECRHCAFQRKTRRALRRRLSLATAGSEPSGSVAISRKTEPAWLTRRYQNNARQLNRPSSRRSPASTPTPYGMIGDNAAAAYRLHA